MRIVYNSFDGRWSDSPRALHEALLHRTAPDGGPLHHTWLAAPEHAADFPAGTATAPVDGPGAVAALEAADLVISNTHLHPQWSKAPGALYLQTWHGTPLKRIAGDEPHVDPAGPVPGWEDVARWDLLLSSGPAATRAMTGAFRYDGPVAETGWPRCDALRAPTAAAVRARVRRDLGVADERTAVLYAPTWRDDVLDERGRRSVDLRLDLADFSRRLGRTHVLLLRLHHMVAARLGPVDLPGVVDVSAHHDAAELYLAADAVVTDYSSVLFDVAPTGAPLLLFAYDLAHYRDDLRGFYLDYEREAPGPVLTTSTALLDALIDPVASTAPWAARRAAFVRAHCPRDDGGATARVLDLVLPEHPRRSGEDASDAVAEVAR